MICSKQLALLEKIVVIVILLSSCTTIVSDYGIIRYCLVGLYLLMVCTHRIRVSNHNNQFLILLIVLFICLMQTIWYGNDNKISYVLKIYTILFMMVMYSNEDEAKNVARIDYLVKLLFLFSFASNIVYVLKLMEVGIHRFTSSLGLYCYYYLLQEFYDPIFGFLNYRNNGIFWEPGVNQVFLNFLLLYTLFDSRNCKSRPCKSKMFIKVMYLILTIVSTGSVMGYALCIAIIGFRCIAGRSNSKKFFLSVFFVVIIIIAFPYALEIFVLKQGTLSYEHRMGDLIIGFNQFFKHPLLGKGIGDESFQKAFFESYNIVRSSSNGLIRLVLATGALGTIFYTVSVYKAARWFDKNILSGSKIAFCIWFFVSLMNEPIESCAIIIYFIGIGWHSRKRFLKINHLSHETKSIGIMRK